MKFPSYKLESEKMAQGKTWVVGCDEAGRGCLAGPVVAAAVILDPKLAKKPPKAKAGYVDWHRELNDSKKLSPVKRFTLEKLLRKHALFYGIGVVSPGNIDKINIHAASLLAMKQAVDALRKKISHATYGNLYVLVDGKFPIPNLGVDQMAIISGDSRVMSIAAASILAKTYRDRLMARLDLKFPEYGFKQHKGYGTPLHLQALRQYGLSTIHRETFVNIS